MAKWPWPSWVKWKVTRPEESWNWGEVCCPLPVNCCGVWVGAGIGVEGMGVVVGMGVAVGGGVEGWVLGVGDWMLVRAAMARRPPQAQTATMIRTAAMISRRFLVGFLVNTGCSLVVKREKEECFGLCCYDFMCQFNSDRGWWRGFGFTLVFFCVSENDGRHLNGQLLELFVLRYAEKRNDGGNRGILHEWNLLMFPPPFPSMSSLWPGSR